MVGTILAYTQPLTIVYNCMLAYCPTHTHTSGVGNTAYALHRYLTMAKPNPVTHAPAQLAAAAATPVVQKVARITIVPTLQYTVYGSKRGLTGGNQPKYGSNNATTLAALQAAQGSAASISGAKVLEVLKAAKHNDFGPYAIGRGWLGVTPATLVVGPV